MDVYVVMENIHVIYDVYIFEFFITPIRNSEAI